MVTLGGGILGLPLLPFCAPGYRAARANLGTKLCPRKFHFLRVVMSASHWSLQSRLLTWVTRARCVRNPSQACSLPLASPWHRATLRASVEIGWSGQSPPHPLPSSPGHSATTAHQTPEPGYRRSCASLTMPSNPHTWDICAPKCPAPPTMGLSIRSCSILAMSAHKMAYVSL